jgi:phosphomannomutase
MTFCEKKLIAFDLDGTLAKSKQPMDSEMATLLGKLLSRAHVAVISGGSYMQFQKQFLPALSSANILPVDLEHLLIFPASGTACYRFRNNVWEKEYEELLSNDEKKKIIAALEHAITKLSLTPKTPYGALIEDRGSQITYSGLGQQAPISEKENWDPDQKKRTAILALITDELTDFSLGIGGTTSIDITRKGTDKAYGIEQMQKILNLSIKDMLFVGDRLEPGGNDAAVLKTGIETFAVKTIEDTKKMIEEIVTSCPALL